MFKLITLATLLIGAVNCYQETAYSNYQDAFSNYQDYFQEPIKPQNGLAIARQALGGLSSGGAALIGVAAAGTAAAVGTVQNANTNANLDASNRRIDSANTKAAATCTKVNSILALAYPTADWTDSSSAFTNANAKVPLSCSSTNPASRFIAPDQTCLASTSTYSLEHAVSFTSASGSIPASNGLAAIPRSVIAQSSTLTTSALSVQDFNSFRLRVAAAINELDDKIRDLLAISSLTC